MTNFPDRDMQRPGYPRTDYPDSFSGNSPMWIIGAVVVVLFFGALWFNFGGAGVRSHPDQGAIQQMTQPAAPSPSPAAPTTAPKP